MWCACTKRVLARALMAMAPCTQSRPASPSCNTHMQVFNLVTHTLQWQEHSLATVVWKSAVLLNGSMEYSGFVAIYMPLARRRPECLSCTTLHNFAMWVSSGIEIVAQEL